MTHLRNGPHGYGLVTKVLHWLTVLLVAGQFVVGYLLDDDGSGRGRGRGRGEGSGRGRGRGGEDSDFADIDLHPVHLGLGVARDPAHRSVPGAERGGRLCVVARISSRAVFAALASHLVLILGKRLLPRML